MTAQNEGALTVLQAAMVERTQAAHQWLVRDLWSHQAVGVIGGPPKSCKTWLGLDLAVSVASATPCLGRFEVASRGPVLVYLAEDALPIVRQRIEAICDHRGLDIATLDLFVVDAPSLRLDLPEDRRRLQATLASLRPALLLLDPLVRLHHLDENSAGDVSRLLGYLRGLQRHFGLAVALVHHMAKRHHAHPGQALRGSGDIHAWADSSAYLLRRHDRLQLTVEHRSAPAREPLWLELVPGNDGLGAHLEVSTEPDDEDHHLPLPEAIRRVLTDAEAPLTRTALRTRLRVNNQKLGDALAILERRHLVRRTAEGWVIATASTPSTADSTDRQLDLV